MIKLNHALSNMMMMDMMIITKKYGDHIYDFHDLQNSPNLKQKEYALDFIPCLHFIATLNPRTNKNYFPTLMQLK